MKDLLDLFQQLSEAQQIEAIAYAAAILTGTAVLIPEDDPPDKQRPA